jgi:hypothetical protein
MVAGLLELMAQQILAVVQAAGLNLQLHHQGQVGQA